ncbi:MAG: dihydroorotate dehydrogenase (fumarate) [Microgenomates group bacterium Gr01-1014_5]|nr:MAG: dihydroorotate dehydrogenase (fumarate) [Microgenomates group bacterium Gr01-1014_5]
MYKEFVRPTLDLLDRTNIVPTETAHIWASNLLHLAEASPLTLKVLERLCAYKGARFSDERLKITVGGVPLENFLMLGAGSDKQGITALAWHALGVASPEFGAVLFADQEGNPKKRQFVLASEPGVILNRLGFNAKGVHAVIRNIKRYAKSGIPIGFNLGINKEITSDEAPILYGVVARALKPYAAYFTINVSSPNTPGLRNLQGKDTLTKIAQRVNAVMDETGGRIPTFVKISEMPLGAVDDVIQVVVDEKLAGLVCINTTTDPDIKAKYGEHWRNEAGGLSGADPDYRKIVNTIIAHVYRSTEGQVPVIGVGGINGSSAALETIKAGAQGLQFVSGSREVGLTLPGRITRGVAEYLDKERIGHVNDLVGIEANNYR